MVVHISVESAAVLGRIDGWDKRIGSAIARALDAQNLLTLKHIVRTKLTNAGPQFLNRRTGHLVRTSRTAKAEIQGNAIESSLGSNVRYAGVHEYGFVGTVFVSAHIRRNPAADKFKAAGAVLSRKGAEKRGLIDAKGRLRKGATQSREAYSHVRGHHREVNFPARAMFRTGVRERLEDYRSAIGAAVVEAWREVQP